nr:putative 2-aminoethylphosphonate ABC transporter substrate-binding protein [uncultured Rhodopila sp.]
MRRLISIAAAALALVALSAPARAQKTRLTVYTALENEQLVPYKAAAEAALKTVEIAWVRDSTGVITARLIAEKANPRADAIWGLSAFSLMQMDGLGMLEGYTPKGAENLRPSFRSSKSPTTWTGMDAFASAICFNTIVARQKNIPTPVTWSDLLKPAFAGQVVMPNPNSSGTGFLTVAGWLAHDGTEAGWAFMTELNKNIATYVHSGSAPCTNAARGEYAAGIGLDMRAVELKNQGAPIDIIVPADGVGYDLEGMAIVKGTKNLDAARRLADFSVSPDANKLFGKFYALLALPGVKASVENYPPEFAQRLVQADFEEIARNRDAILQEWARRFDSKSAPK